LDASGDEGLRCSPFIPGLGAIKVDIGSAATRPPDFARVVEVLTDAGSRIRH
jgi:hypothetical protein